MSDAEEKIRQRQAMGRGEGPFKAETFGVGAYPGSRSIPGKPDGGILTDEMRGIGRPVGTANDCLPTQRNADHGPHR